MNHKKLLLFSYGSPVVFFLAILLVFALLPAGLFLDIIGYTLIACCISVLVYSIWKIMDLPFGIKATLFMLFLLIALWYPVLQNVGIVIGVATCGAKYKIGRNTP